jgi:ankyrin repeat protein
LVVVVVYCYVIAQEKADGRREELGIPLLDTVFSQARNGRIKRVEESLNLGFPIDAEDEKGHTLLLVAAQNSNKRLVEMLLLRGASINHQNAQGNTALHYALAFDNAGALGEYLIEHGADDTVENVGGLTPYDGVAV